MEEREALRGSVWDPTGNITALVESPVPAAEQPAAAAALMRRRPEIEQVGFVELLPPGADGPRASLRMAGGEFCGNASMSAAALCLLRAPESGAAGELRVRVSGAAEPVAVRLRCESGSSFAAWVRMPAPEEIAERDFVFEGRAGRLVLVRMAGIAHLLIEPGSVFSALLGDREAALRAVRAWCAALEAPALGLLFLEGSAPACRLTPLVYVPGSGTAFWENSCASGSAAAGMALAARAGAPLSLRLAEPGGTLCVESAPGGETWLGGRTRLVGGL